MSTFCILKYFIVMNHILGKNNFFRFYAVSAIFHLRNGDAIVNFYNFYNVDINVCLCAVFDKLGNFSLKC